MANDDGFGFGKEKTHSLAATVGVIIFVYFCDMMMIDEDESDKSICRNWMIAWRIDLSSCIAQVKADRFLPDERTEVESNFSSSGMPVTMHDFRSRALPSMPE